MLLVYYMLATVYTATTLDDMVYASAVQAIPLHPRFAPHPTAVLQWTSHPPGVHSLGAAFNASRSPQARLLDNNGVGMANERLIVEVADWRPLDITEHADCSKYVHHATPHLSSHEQQQTHINMAAEPI